MDVGSTTIVSLAQTLEAAIQQSQQELKERENEFVERELKFQKQKEEMAKRYPISEKVIELNVGGKHFTTYKETLCKVEGSMLEAMFSGRHPNAKDSKSRYFIDRDGEAFGIILNFLRTGVFVWPEDERLKETIKLDLEYYGLLTEVSPSSVIFQDSTLLTPEYQQRLLEFLLEGNINNNNNQSKQANWKLLYKGSRDGFLSAQFHARCDNKGPTITLVKSANNCVFGGYCAVSWSTNGATVPDSTAFLFCLKNHLNQSFKCNILNSFVGAIANSRSYGPAFGAHMDMWIANNCDVTTNSSAKLGGSYVPHNGDPCCLTGQQNFVVSDIEVFGIDLAFQQALNIKYSNNPNAHKVVKRK